MIAVLKSGTTAEQTTHLVNWLKNMGLDVHISEGHEFTVLGLIGNTTRVDIELLSSLEIIESVKRVSEPFKQANRKFHPDDSVIDIGGVKIGGGIGVALTGWLLEAGGYIENAVVQSQSCVNMLNFIYLWLPLIINVIITVLLCFLKVEKANKDLDAKAKETIEETVNA